MARSQESVLDLSRLLPGPFASLVLADLGAQVDKIEDTAGGDYLRVMPPCATDPTARTDVERVPRAEPQQAERRPRSEEARGEARRSCGSCARYDVLLEQFRPGVLDRLGLSHATLLEANPRLVVCALTGYGQTGPLAQRAGHDLNYLARAGVLGLQGPAEAPPQLPGFQLADVSGGLWCAIGIMGALRSARAPARERSSTSR